MDAAHISAMVAGLAVIVSGIMQFLTVRQSRENTKETLAVTRDNAVLTAEKTRENTILTLEEARRNIMASIASADTQKWVDALSADLAEFIALALKTNTRFQVAYEERTDWPGEHEEIVLELEVLKDRVLIRLDSTNETQRNLEESVWNLVSFRHKDLWIDRKLRLIDNARKVF